ncbi:amidase signature domain-containing protein [Infundibulicybe gibba]|nr:amidase signature domain-containing protein [Infundibulicybe gibba]
MIFPYSPAAHQNACAWKQRECQAKIDSFPAEYFTPLSLQILLAYAKNTLRAHNHMECITDFMFDKALQIPAVANWESIVSPVSTPEVHPTHSHLLMGVPCVSLPWRPIDLQDENRKLKWGVIWEDGTIPPTPACKRALSCVINALLAEGHEIFTFDHPNIPETLGVGYELIFSDGGAQIHNSLLPFETLGALTKSIITILSFPRFLKKVLTLINRSWDPLFADLLENMNTKTILQERALIMKRDKYRAAWHDQWHHQGLDFVLTVPHALPALSQGSSEMLDYPSGMLPVTFVDKGTDSLSAELFTSPQYQRMNTIAKCAYSLYDATTMHGLPVGVQVAGCRLEEEKVLEGMKMIERALRKNGTVFLGIFLVSPAANIDWKLKRRWIEFLIEVTRAIIEWQCGCTGPRWRLTLLPMRTSSAKNNDGWTLGNKQLCCLTYCDTLGFGTGANVNGGWGESVPHDGVAEADERDVRVETIIFLDALMRAAEASGLRGGRGQQH